MKVSCSSTEIRSTRAPTLREDQIGILRRYGQERKTEIGDVLFRAGDTQNDFIVILEGEVEVVDDFAGEARTIGVFLAGRFLGELNMLTGQAMYLTAVVREGGEVLAIPRERLTSSATSMSMATLWSPRCSLQANHEPEAFRR
jgi:thioredoxin reductase (NADPH)